MCSVQQMRESVHERISTAVEDFLLMMGKGGESREAPVLSALLTERLTEEILGLFEKTVAEYEDRVYRSEQEICRQRKLLHLVLKPEVKLNRAAFTPDVQQLLVSKEEVYPEQQQWSPSLDQEGPEPSHIKEEQKELWTSQEGEQLQGLEEDDIIKITFTPVPVKSEDYEEPQSSQLHQSQSEETREAEPLASTSTDQMKPEADGDCGGSEPASNLDPARDLQPTSADQLLSPHCSEPETEDSDDYPVGERPFSCLVCGKRFLRKENLQKHMRVHTGENPFVCSVCNKSFDKSGELGRHMRSHTGENPFSCSVCNKRFIAKGALLEHIRLHTRKKPFVCSVCGKNFLYSGKLRRHMRSHTGEKPFSCSVCNKSCSQKWALVEHMRVHTGEKPYSCSFCNKGFSAKGAMVEHIRIHTGEKPFVCSVCSKCFRSSGTLTTHMRSHTGEKPFSCLVCSKSFSQKKTLVIHMRVHTGESPFSCSVCNKSFSGKKALVEHIRLHTGEKPFSCSVCNKSFTQKGTLVTHLRVHTGEKPYSCIGCGKRFSHQSSAKRHRCVCESSSR